MGRTALVTLGLALLAGSGWAQTMTPLLTSGTTGAKKDLAIIGDGFQAGADQDAFNTFVNSYVMAGVFGEGPFREDIRAFNIYRVNAISTDSGVTQVDANGKVTSARQTALDYRYSGEFKRWWMEPGPNTSSRLNAILDGLTPGWDYVFIVVNEPRFGGHSNGNRVAVTLDADWTVGSHEMGHLIGALADEYCNKGTYAGSEPWRANITKNVKRKTLKWRALVKASTPVPTGVNTKPGSAVCTDYTKGTAPAGWSADGDVGLFEGAQYKDDDVYRPVVNCRMRSSTPRFCPVCAGRIKENLAPFHD